MVKKAIITVFGIIVLAVVSSEALTTYRGIPSRFWSDTACGGIDPYHDFECRFVGAGYKQQCRFFVCTKEPVPYGLPRFDTGDVAAPVDAVDDDEDDEVTEPSN